MKLRLANNLLIVCIIVINGSVIVMPFLPKLAYAQAQQSGKPKQLTAKLHSAAVAVTAPNQAAELIIPNMTLDQPIVEGNNSSTALSRGIWRWPASSTPDKGGNTVLLGHRFTYTNPRGVFYFLDKLAIGDEIGIVWNNKKYLYTVTSSRVVPPTETTILDNTSEARLTLFTCTPLWSPKDRLVVTASPETGP